MYSPYSTYPFIWNVIICDYAPYALWDRGVRIIVLSVVGRIIYYVLLCVVLLLSILLLALIFAPRALCFCPWYVIYHAAVVAAVVVDVGAYCCIVAFALLHC